VAELMTLEEVANYLRGHRKDNIPFAGQHGIPAMRVGHLWRFDKASIDIWLNQSFNRDGDSHPHYR